MTTAPPKLSALSWAALVLGGAGLIVLALQVTKLVGAAFMPSAGVGDVRKAVEEQAQRYAAAFDPQMAQINGRQLFLIPAPAPVVADDTPADEPVTEPTTPTVYSGPSIIAMINDVVWFSNGARIAAGDKDGDLKIVSIDAPWSAQVQWRGSEFTVKLFDRDAVVLPAADQPSSRRTPVVPAPELSPAPAKPAAKPDESPKPGPGSPQPAAAPGTPGTPAQPEHVEPVPAEPAPAEPSQEPSPERARAATQGTESRDRFGSINHLSHQINTLAPARLHEGHA